MNFAINPQRKDLMKQVLDATTMLEVEAATTALDRWLEAHPDDQGMEDGYEQLALMRDGLLSEAEHLPASTLLAKAS